MATAVVEPVAAGEPVADTPAPAAAVVEKDANASVAVDMTKPEDFEGNIDTTNQIPSAETIEKINSFVVLDGDGKSHTFESLYNGPNSPRRVLLIFVRHFFCGNCQNYLEMLSESITPDALLALPISTFIAVIGCGDPALISMYRDATKCPYPIYTDPQHALFNALGMIKTLSLGERPAYMKNSLLQTTILGVKQALKSIPKGLTFKSGDQRQVGGEFLFEPVDITTPVSTPMEDKTVSLGNTLDGSVATANEATHFRETKRVTWAHRMKNTRDHAEIPELMEVLGLDGQGKPIEDSKRWAAALAARKGTGLSMAPQIKEAAAAAVNETK